MMLRFRSISMWLFIPVGLWPAHPSQAKTTKTPSARTVPAPRREIQAIYNKMNAAVARKDVDGFFDYNDTNLTIIDQKGHVHESSEGRQELEQLLEGVDNVKGSSTVQSFTGTDTEATVTVKEHYILGASSNVNGRAVKVTIDDVARDYWVFTADGWRRKRSRILSEKGTFHKNF